MNLLAVAAFVCALVVNLTHQSWGPVTDFTLVIIGFLCLALGQSAGMQGTYERIVNRLKK